MYPREAIDFERHPMPRASMARIRDRLADRGGPHSKTDVGRSPCREGLPASDAALGQGTTASALPATTE